VPASPAWGEEVVWQVEPRINLRGEESAW